MRPSCSLLLLGATALTCATFSPVPTVLRASQAPEEVVLSATVLARTGEQLTTLTADDFKVTDDGLPQKVTSVTRITGVPVAFVILLDASNSMKGDFEKFQSVAVECARGLRPIDQAALIGFNSQPETLADFTNDPVKLERAIKEVRVTGSTALHNAIYRTLRVFDTIARREGNKGRRVILVLSDGEDTSSLITLEEILKLARAGDTVINAVDTKYRQWTRDQADLEKLVNDTGGRRLVPDKSVPLGQMCSRIMEEASSYYAVRFASTPRNPDGKWRRIDVRVSVPGAKVFSRAGYFAPNSNPK